MSETSALDLVRPSVFSPEPRFTTPAEALRDLRVREFFRVIDGVETPSQLLGIEDPGLDRLFREWGLNESAIRENVDLAGYRTTGYFVTRGLIRSRPPYEELSYVDALGMSRNTFVDALEEIRADQGGRRLSVFDLGCGQGVGFEDLLELEAVDPTSSIGITLPNIQLNPYKQGPQISHANVVHLAPKHQADATFSVFGTTSYHPMDRQFRHHTRGTFGLLQAIGFTREGGWIFHRQLKDLDPDNEVLEEEGILRHDPHFSFRNKKNPGINAQAWQVLRHPTHDEIRELLLSSPF